MSTTPDQTAELGRSDGRLIVIEGMDGSGKTTQVKLLVSALREGYPAREVLPLRAPGGTELGEHVRSLVKNPDAVMNKEARFLLFMAAQAQLTQEVMIPALNRGAIVIMDRFLPSAYAYQHAADGIPLKHLRPITEFATMGVLPNMTLLLEVSVATAKKRIQKEAGRLGDAFDHLPDTYLERVMDGYTQWFLAPRTRGTSTWIISGDSTQRLVHLRILEYVKASMAGAL